MRKLTEQDIAEGLTQDAAAKIAAAFSNASRLVPVNVGAKEGSFKGVFFLCRVERYTAAQVRATVDPNDWIHVDPRLSALEAPPGLTPCRVPMGVVQMEEPSSTESVRLLVQGLGLEVCCYAELLAAILHPGDLLRGPPVVSLGDSLSEPAAYPRHNAFYPGERGLSLEHERKRLEFWEKGQEYAKAHPNACVLGPRPLPGWPAEYRFLVKARPIP